MVTVCGDATNPQVLEAAGIATADVAAGVLARDPENLAFAMLVRSMSSARVMVRMLDTSYREAYRLAGVKELVAEAEVVVAKMTTAIDFPQVTGSLPLAGGDALLFELAINPRALVAGKTVAQVRTMDGLPARVPLHRAGGSAGRHGGCRTAARCSRRATRSSSWRDARSSGRRWSSSRPSPPRTPASPRSPRRCARWTSWRR